MDEKSRPDNPHRRACVLSITLGRVTVIESGERGKYAKRYREEGTSVVLIDPVLQGDFPDLGSVTRALREYLECRRQAMP